jgi:hypothetical protein
VFQEILFGPEEQKIAQYFRGKNNDDIKQMINDPKQCDEIMKWERGLSKGSTITVKDPTRDNWPQETDREEFQKQYQTSVDTIVKSRIEIFQKDFDARLKHMYDELHRTIRDEADRTIKRLEGPYARLKDKVCMNCNALHELTVLSLEDHAESLERTG